MKRFLSRMIAWFKKSRQGRSRTRQDSVRLQVENLEERMVMSAPTPSVWRLKEPPIIGTSSTDFYGNQTIVAKDHAEIHWPDFTAAEDPVITAAFSGLPDELQPGTQYTITSTLAYSGDYSITDYDAYVLRGSDELRADHDRAFVNVTHRAEITQWTFSAPAASVGAEFSITEVGPVDYNGGPIVTIYRYVGTAATVAKPSAPNLTATPVSVNTVRLSWTGGAGATSFLIYQDGVYLKEVTGTNSTDVSDLGPRTYQFMVGAQNSAGETPSNTETVNMLQAPVVKVTLDNSFFRPTISWNDVAPGNANVSYDLTLTNTMTQQTYVKTGLPGTEWTFGEDLAAGTYKAEVVARAYGASATSKPAWFQAGIQAGFKDNSLTITGTLENDRIKVGQSNDQISIQGVQIFVDGKFQDSVPGGQGYVSISVLGQDGDDNIQLDGGSQPIHGSTEIDGGLGMDFVAGGKVSVNSYTDCEWIANNWAPNGTRMQDVFQRKQGNCTVLAVLASMALRGEDLTHRIEYLGDYKYNVSLYNSSGVLTKVPVTFDGWPSTFDPKPYLSFGEKNDTHPPGPYPFWTILFRQAFLTQTGVPDDGVSYKSAFQRLTGRDAATLSFSTMLPDDGFWLFDIIEKHTRAGNNVIMGTWDREPASDKLYRNHAYTVIQVTRNLQGLPGSVQIRNPHGEDGRNFVDMDPNDGMIDLSWEQFRADVARVSHAGDPIARVANDAFDLPDSTSLDADWTEPVGDFRIASGRVMSTTGTDLAIRNDLTAADVTVAANVTVTGAGTIAGVAGRYSGPGDQNMYYGAVYSSGFGFNAQIYKNLGGTWTLLSQQAVSKGTGTLRFELVGPSLQLFWNDAQVGSVNDTSLRVGSAGIRANRGGLVDDFHVSGVNLEVATLPFEDAFAQDGALDQPWIGQAGSVSIQNNVLRGSTGVDVATLFGVNESDVSVQADVTVAGNSGVGLAARYSGIGDTNMYLGALFPTARGVRAQIYRNVNGAWALLSDQAAPGSTGTLRFQVVGSSLKLFLNNVLVGSAYDTALTTGSVGVRTWYGQSTVDNFAVSKVELANAQLPYHDGFAGTQLANTWMERVGAVAVQGDVLRGTTGYDLVTLNGVNRADVSVQADVNLNGTSGGLGLAARYSGAGDHNMYLGAVHGLNAIIFKNVGGTWSVLSSQAIASAAGTLRFEVVGTSLRLFFNNVLVGSAYDGSLTSGTVGVRMWATAATVDNFSAGTITLMTPNLPFQDDFTGTGTSLSRNWLERMGGFNIQSNQLRGSTGYDVATLNGVNQSDVVVEADVTLPGAGGVSLAARYAGDGDHNMYLGALTSNGPSTFAQIFKNVAGVWTLLSSQAVGANSGALRFEVVGSSLKLFFNNVLVGNVNDTSLASGTVGVRMWSTAATMDNFRAATTELTTPALPFRESFDGTVLSRNWVERVGLVSVQGGSARGSGKLDLATLHGVSQADVIVSADVNLNGATGGVALAARYSGSGDDSMYLGSLERTGGVFVARIYRNLGGVWTLLSQQTVSAGAGSLRFEVIGSSLKLFCDDVLVASASDGNITTGSAGVRLWAPNASVDNFHVA